jgi:hypothetical protein
MVCIVVEENYKCYGSNDDVMTYPNEHSGKYPQKIPSPKKWGLIISPDHSISSEHFNQN